MKINGKVHCFFEQSGTFKREFIKLGIPAEDYDIQNNFGETDNVIDLFAEIEKGYDGKQSVFDRIEKDDLIMAFFPCIYFCQMSQYAQSMNCNNYRGLSDEKKIEAILERQKNRNDYLMRLTRFVHVCIHRNLRMIFENPITGSFLMNYFLKPPTIKDMNRMYRGDYFVKPTGYWFWNCKPTFGFTKQKDKIQKKICRGSLADGVRARSSKVKGVCSEARSMISPDYARNFIADFILGKPSGTIPQQTDLFDALGAED